MKRASLLLMLGCLGSLACGDLGDADDNPPLAVIEGQLSQAGMSPSTGNVRVAVVWNTSTTGFRTSVDVPASPQFPSKFRLELRDPPPATAMIKPSEAGEPDPTVDHPLSNTQSRPLDANSPSSFAIAVGSVVAYEDLDGDRKLGLIDPDTVPPDRVLGTNEELLVVYIEGDVSQAGATLGTSTPARGYNLLRAPRCRIGETCPPATWLPISTPYELPLTADPQLADLMCRSAIGEMTASPTTSSPPKPAPGPDGWPDPKETRIVCNAGGQSYSLIRCQTTSTGLCKAAHQSCTQETWTLPSTPPPAEWPCPIE
jgi:hypothetical protein